MIMCQKLSSKNIMADPIQNAYIVAVDMGYGHQRAAYPLENIAALPEGWQTETRIISANNYPLIPRSDRIRWALTRKTYELISRVQGFPILGKRIFRLMDAVEAIQPFYPKQDLSSSIFSQKIVRNLVNGGFGKHLIDTLNRKPLPLIATFPLPALMAEIHNYKGEIYTLCTDTDIARGWVPVNAKTSRIKYLAPTVRVKERLKLYGVPASNIFVTGFPVPPMPQEKLGERIVRLDPSGAFRKRYEKLISLYIDSDSLRNSSGQPVTVVFSIGGAGAQVDIGLKILRSLSMQVRNNKFRLILVAGTSTFASDQFEAMIHELDLDNCRGKSVDVLYYKDKYMYFREFNRILEDADVLWSKPSELSFYAALGLPIIMSPPLGPQEESNRSWLLMMGAGFEQYDPRYANEWLVDWLHSGWLAKAAVNGFINAPRDATLRIADLVLRGVKNEIDDVNFV